MKSKLIFIIFLILPIFICAQDTWVKTYEPFGDNSAHYYGSNLVICPDSGYAFNGSYDTWHDPGGYIFTHPYLIRTDSEGNLLWANNDFGNYYDSEGSICLAVLEDSCFMATVGKDLIKLSANGEYLWHISFDDPIFVPFSVDITNDQNIILGGVSDYQYPMLKKISSDGEVLFSNSYEYNTSIDSQILSVKCTNDSCYLMTGWFKDDLQTQSDIIVIKTNSVGDSLWTRIIDTSIHDHATCITENSDNGNIFISGYSFNPDYGILVLLSNDGEIIWINTSSIVGLYPNAVLYSSDNKYVVGAYEMYCIDENCSLIWDSESKPVGNDKYIKILDDNYIVFTGLHNLPYNNHIVSLSKANAEGNIVSIDSSNFNPSIQSYLIENRPNPFTLKTSISFLIPNVSDVEISIYNIKGQKVKIITNQICQKGLHQVVWNGDDASGNNVAAGVYFYKLKVNGKTEAVNKCVVLK